MPFAGREVFGWVASDWTAESEAELTFSVASTGVFKCYRHPDLTSTLSCCSLPWSVVKLLRKYAAKLKPYRPGIAGRARWPVHTDQLDGINKRIKVMKWMTYGYRDSDFIVLKIKAAFPGNPQ